MAQNGAPTIRQMEVFVSEVLARGGVPADSWEYLRQYVDRLMEMVHKRWEVLESGRATPAEWLVPGVHGLLENLRNRGLPLFVASGTDYAHVSHEAEILGVEQYFPSGINAPRNNDPTFRKATVIASIVNELGIAGSELLSFGDGMVETAEVKRIGGVAIGVASSEYGSGTGIVNRSKRNTLLAAGADAIVADYTHQRELIRWLWGE
jgi:phosphoglycolate phosphatase-like HAD superfamily hydrolase